MAFRKRRDRRSTQTLRRESDEKAIDRSGNRAPNADSRAVLEAIRRIVQSIRVASRRNERHLGASAARLLVLATLDHAGPLSLNEVARRTLTHQSSASVIVSKLVERGLIRRTRSTRDARQQQLSLTANGRKLVHAGPDAASHQFLTALSHMSRRDVSQLSRLLVVFVGNLGIARSGNDASLDDVAAP